MGKDQNSCRNFFRRHRRRCYTLLLISILTLTIFLYLNLFKCPIICCHDSHKFSHLQISNDVVNTQIKEINLLKYSSSWNSLDFPAAFRPPPKLLKIALFVKKWPEKRRAGGMERHALTLYLALAKRGHHIHIFTASSSPAPSSSSVPVVSYPNMHFHVSRTMSDVWNQFLKENSTAGGGGGAGPFDVVHTESVALRHTLSKNLTNVAASWHGIAYESIHSDVIQELVRSPEEPSSPALTERVLKVVEEVKFFPSYTHHVATCDNVGDILKRIYLLPEERVHIILNGVDEEIFKPNISAGLDFLNRVLVNYNITDKQQQQQDERWRHRPPLILGMAGRLVKDKGHPLMFEALKQIFKENSIFRENVVVLVAGDGPWATRYRDLGPSVKVLGAMDRKELGRFYNAIDVFVHPTLRAQGFDQTLLEAVLTGKPLMVTKMASIRETGVVDDEMGYVFTPDVDSLKRVLYKVFEDGKEVLEKKGRLARALSLKLFTATKMVAAYENLFLCIADEDYCIYRS